MLKGTLDDFTLSDIFRLTSHARKTGRLEVERRNGSGRVYFRDGDVYYAESTKSKEPLGQKLVRSGWVTEERLREAVQEQQTSGKRLGEILIAGDAVNEAQIEWAIKSQIEDAVFDLLRWDLGAFVWEPDVVVDAEVPLVVSVENLIIEAARRLDEIDQIKKKIPGPDIVLAMAPRPPDGAVEISITPEEWRVLVLVDGHRSVADIASLIGADAFLTTRQLFGLLNAGLIVKREAQEPASEYETRPATRRPSRAQRSEPATEASEPRSNVVELQRDGDDQVVSPPPAPVPGPARPATPEPPRRPPAPEPEHTADEVVAQARREQDSKLMSPAPRVDRAAVVRELAGLFSEETKPRPRAVPSGSTETKPKPHPEPPEPRRVEDDDDVDRGLISRMIDGVKGL